jgi:branched-chain amino acid aminotransferase
MIIDVLQFEVQKAMSSKLQQIDLEKIPFGKVFTDHMFSMDFYDNKWQEPKILPYGKLELSPSISALHYGQAIFEGMKAYKNFRAENVMFRPHDNIKRFNQSASRMCMPKVPDKLFMEGLRQLIIADRDWIPEKKGFSLYIRPMMFGTEERIIVKPSEEFKFLIIASPAGKYYSEPIKVYIETHYSRAAKGGVGNAKTAGNYGAAMFPTQIAKNKGYHQVIWTDANEHKYIEEAGTMNVMFVIDEVLVTPQLTDTKLPGITRHSVLSIAREWGVKVEERPVTIDEILEAYKEGKLKEAFGTGTAATIAHIKTIGHQDQDYDLPDANPECLSSLIAEELNNIKFGTSTDKFGWIHKV